MGLGMYSWANIRQWDPARSAQPDVGSASASALQKEQSGRVHGRVNTSFRAEATDSEAEGSCWAAMAEPSVRR